MASITKRGKTWQYTVSRYTDGKYDPVRKGGFKTKKEAQVAALDVEMRLQKGANVLSRDKPFPEYFEFWIDKFKSNRRDNTYKRYKDSLKHVQNYFNDRPIQKITSDLYQVFINDYAATHSKESVRKLNTHIRACVRDAIDDGYLAIDFTRKTHVWGAVAAKRTNEKYIDYEESKRLYEHLLLNNDNLTNRLILLALVSGLRYGELVGLTFNACDFKNNTIYVYQAWDYEKGTGFTDLKNTPSERTIPIDPEVMHILYTYVDNNPESNEYGLLFYSVGKVKVVTNNAVNKQLARLIKNLNVSTCITCHGLRHTHASVLLHDGFNIQYISERLGHESVQTTMSTYSHILKELRAREDENILLLYKQKKTEDESSDV